MSEPTATHEFLSEGWRRATAANMTSLLEELGDEVAGVTFSLVELFVDVPARLEPAGQVVWHFRMVGGAAKYWADTVVEPDDLLADVRFVMDAATAAPLATIVVDGDPEAVAKLTELSTEAMRTGAIRMRGDAAMPGFYDRFHDMNARLTTA